MRTIHVSVLHLRRWGLKLVSMSGRLHLLYVLRLQPVLRTCRETSSTGNWRRRDRPIARKLLLQRHISIPEHFDLATLFC